MQHALKFSKFAVIGVGATATHAGILALCVELLHLDPVLSNPLAFFVAFQVTFFGNRHWTFKSQGKALHEYFKQLFVQLGGLALNTGILALFTKVFGLHYMVGFLVATGVVPLVTYCFNYFWVYKQPAKADEQDQEDLTAMKP